MFLRYSPQISLVSPLCNTGLQELLRDVNGREQIASFHATFSLVFAFFVFASNFDRSSSAMDANWTGLVKIASPPLGYRERAYGVARTIP